ncbi:uncharacterized protein LOC120336341 isoform X1 [Styela clava]
MSNLKDDTGVYHLTVGTEVSAKYRGAFCEAQIKVVKKNVSYKVLSKKTGKSCHLSEENINGVLKIGSAVEALFPEQTDWQECTIQSAKDKSSYTVIFDDGDERTLSRGSLCLKGDRHYAKSETLDNLPLTDPENFGTPVLAMKKSRSRRRPVEDEYDDESEDQRTPEKEKPPKDTGKKKTIDESDKQESSSEEEEEDDDEKRKRWLADPLMGKVVIVEPNDKRKHWFPGLVVNPLCYERHRNLAANHIVVRSFKTGKFLRVNRSSVKEMTSSTIPTKLDSVWKDVIFDAQNWQNSRVVSDEWRIDIKDILSDSEDDESSDEEKNDKNKKKSEKEDENEDDKKEKEEEKKNHDFLEILYKFMDDRGTPINKTPVLGYKDLDLHLLYGLVEQRQGSLSIKSIKDWKQIYLDLGIPKPNPAAGYNVRTAYAKYLGAYEEYCMSWKHLPLPVKKSSNVPGSQNSASKEKKKVTGKIKEEPPEKVIKKEVDKTSQEKRKIKLKDKDAQKNKSLDSSAEGKTRGRNSPNIVDLKALTQQRRTAQRRRASESSSASDVTTVSSGKSEKKKTSKTITSKKDEERFRSPGGPDSEPDDSSRSIKTEKKESVDKKNSDKSAMESAVLKRIRRNSTSNVSTQYVQGDRLKVKYGQGKTFKIYDAKILQVKPPEGPGEVTEYLVHYQGWNARHDEIIKPHRIVGLADDHSIPQSPSSHTKSPRRPKTPNSSRHSSGGKDDIMPSPGLSIELSKRFSIDTDLSHITDELPSFISKPRVSHGLKKNLSEELAKSAKSSESSKSASYGNSARAGSPVLVGSQRTKRSKSPQIKPEPHNRSPVLVRSKPIEKSCSSKEKTNGKSSPVREKESAVKKLEEKDKIVIKTEPETAQNEVSKLSTAKSKSNESTEKDTDSSSSTNSIVEEETVKDETIDDNSDDTQEDLATPIQQPRRTSTRRSKSPAYLSDSWYQPKKRKFSTSNEKTPSPVPTPTSESPTEKPSTPTLCKPFTNHPISAVRKSQRSPSPSLSTSSSNSTESEATSKEKSSPILLSSPAASNSPVTTKNRDKSKSKGTKTQEKSNTKSEVEDGNDKNNNNKNKLTETLLEAKQVESLQTSEYDNFDEEAPSIALEKHKKSSQSLIRSNDNKHPLDPVKIISAKDEKEGIEIGQTESLVHEREVKVTAARKTDERNDEPNRRKIRKRKANNNAADQNEPPKSPKVEKIESEEKVESSSSDKSASPPDTQQSNIPTVTASDDIATEGPSSSVATINHENSPATNNAPSLNVTTLPQNPPSSSKSLLENTPPTTPEQSPTHVSEDQDMEIEKHSPMVDSDAMDIGEERKESMENTSSSGNEQPSYSGKSVTGKDDKETENNDKQEDDTQAQSLQKKRGRKKRTNQKNRNNRRLSCGNDKDSESEDEADNETGEATRKRHDSGKQRKKRAKTRPEPPTAPPPLPREKLENMSQDERIALLQSRMAEMRKVYHQLKQEVANIDRKRKRAKRREREAAEAAQSISKQAQSPCALSKVSNVTENKVEQGTTDLSENNVANVQVASEGDTKSEDGGQSI